MAEELLTITAQIVMSHASATELTPRELVDEIKEVHNLLVSLEGEGSGNGVNSAVGKEEGEVRKPSIPLDRIVTDKYVVCLECHKQFRTLKNHLAKNHQLTPAEYLRRYGLDAEKYPVVCKEYSEHRRRLAKEHGLGLNKRQRLQA
jgi:predicted transcriptional regulator